jgi:hypothetical protein
MPPTNADEPLPTVDHHPSPAAERPPGAVQAGAPPAQAGAAATVSDPLATGPYRQGQPAAVPAVSSGPEPGPPAVAGYEILGVLGRGGMGVVYKAHHLALKRVVALKMILAGGHAGAQERSRFKAEAEAVARLQHPGIVQVHEVGEADGHLFCDLEFVEGGSLAQKLGGRPLPPREAARLVEALARAMHLAHSRNIVHRDLKPANVLLTADGTPKVTDFGLARQLDADSGDTRVGTVMGTPSYMAPEQASGRAHEAGPAADVYALGAILYACLTGRPPFQGATVVETLEQVRSQEPVPPARLQPKVLPDLDTVCLKCLRKEPEWRYASAAELADELGRFLRGEPVLARPVSPLERAAKWVRRTPALAGAIVSAAAALLLGAAVSTWFAIDASREAGKARANEATARQKEADAIAARNDLKTANGDLARTADNLETTLARSFLRPLALLGGDKPMTDPEWESLWDLATNRRGRVGYRFVEEASRAPVTSKQLRDRAALALPAAVGLDAERRAEVEALLLARLDDPALGDEQKTDLALAASAWDGLGSSGAVGMARQLTRALTATRTPDARKQLARGLAAVSVRMEARDAAAVAAQAATTLLQFMKDAKNLFALNSLAVSLSAVSAHMEAREAAAVAGQAATILLQAMKESLNRGLALRMEDLTEGLLAVAVRLEARDAAQAVTMLVQATKAGADTLGVAREMDWSALMTRLDASDAAQAAASLVQAMKDVKDQNNRLAFLAQGLSAVSVRLESREAALALTTLIQALMKETKDFAHIPYLGRGLSAVSARLDARDAAQTATTLVQAMKDTKNEPYRLSFLAQGLAAVSARLESRDAARALPPLIQAIKETTHPNAFLYLVQGLSAVSARLDARDAARAATTLVQAMKDTKAQNPNAFHYLAQSWSVVSARLESRDAAQTAATLLQAMKEARDSLEIAFLAQQLSVLGARLEAKDGAAVAPQAVPILVQVMKDAKNPAPLPFLAQGLSALSAHLEPREAAAVAGQAATILLQAMKDAKDSFGMSFLAQGLGSVSAHLEAKETVAVAGQAATTLLQAMKDTKNPKYPVELGALARGLTAVSAHLEPREAAAVAGQAATTLLQAMKGAKNPNAPGDAYARAVPLAQGLSGVSAFMEADEAATAAVQAAVNLFSAMAETSNPAYLQGMGQCLQVLLADNNSASERTCGIQRCAAVASVAGAGQPLTALPSLIPAAAPLPCRLSAQQLVELLKMPTCIGDARRVVLDHLGSRYKRTFVDAWEFVRFAKEQRLDDLDFTSPAARPEPPTPAR